MRVHLLHVYIPAMSTIGYGEGLDAEERRVQFVGDHRPMRHLGEALAACAADGEDAPKVELEDWQIIS